MSKFSDVYKRSEWGEIERRSHERVRTVIRPAAPSDQDWVKGYCAGLLTATIVFGTIIGALLCRLY